jgi:hypothetical protein
VRMLRGGLLTVAMLTPLGAGQAAVVHWDKLRLGAKSSVNVLWVGHSLIEQKAETPGGVISIMSVVGEIAKAKGLKYAMTDHTLWGAPLSGLWEGKAFREDRDMSEMKTRRIAFEAHAERFDTVVATERIPLHWSNELQFASFYLRRFYCSVVSRNPQARVYLYQTWPHLQGSPIEDAAERAKYNWRETMRRERAEWDALADAARKTRVPAPGLLSRIGRHKSADAGCSLTGPIFTVPAGTAMGALADRLETPAATDVFTRPDGRRFRFSDLAGNPDDAWQEGPHAEAPKLRNPSKPLDDIHLGAEGIYFVALVQFATIYRQSPIGAPVPASLGEPLGRTLQCIAWQAVVNDPRAGVAGDPAC